MKKINALILTFVLILQCATGVFAEDVTAGWKISYGGTGNTDRGTYFANVTEAYSRTGSKSLLIKYPAEYNAENYVEVKYTLDAPLETGKYTVSFYNRLDATKYTQVLVGNNAIFGFKDTSEGCNGVLTAGETENGWKKYSATFDYTAGSGDFVSFRVFKNKMEYIDDVSLIKEGSTLNLIDDSGFEDYEEDGPVISDEEEYDTTDYQPLAMLASPGNGRLVLNWVNPATTDLKAVKLYDITGGKTTLLSDSLSATPGKRVYHTLTGLSNGSNYQYKIVFSYNTKASREYYLAGSPKNLVSKDYGDWVFSYVINADAQHVPGLYSIDTEEYRGDSGASLKYVSNIDRKLSHYTSNTYFWMKNSVAVEPSTKYIVSMWVKTVKLEDGVMFRQSWTDFDGINHYDKSFVGTTDGWKQVTYEFTTKDNQTNSVLQLDVDTSCVALWVDDVTFVKADDPEGKNLIKNGDFENLISEKTDEFASVTAEPGYNEGTLKIGLPNSNYAGAKIYQKVFDKFEYRGTLSSNVTELNISGLDGEKEYTYKLVPFNDDYVCGTGTEVSFTTLMADYDIGDITLTQNGKEVENVTAGGTYYVTVSAKNNKVDGGFVYEQFAALYNGDKLIGVFSTEKKVPKKAASASYTKTSTAVTVPSEEGNYRLTVFVTDGRETFKMHVKPVEF